MKNTRQPSVAGQFYPEGREELSFMIDSFLKNVKASYIKGLKALIVPHAGYVFSGPVAATGYSILKGMDQSRKYRIILLGPSHRIPLSGTFTDSSICWKTPLGTVELFRNVFPQSKEAHAHEHSLEVQVPFLQKVLKDFSVMPLVYGEENPKELAARIIKLLKEDMILIVSSDLSHYLPYEEAVKADMKTCKGILELDSQGLSENEDSACGRTGIMALIEIAKRKGWKPNILKYANSGDTSGDRERVVGYACFAFTGGENAKQ